MDIIPAILVKTPEEFASQLQNLSPFYTHFQIDIADGEFVKNKTIDIEDILPALKALEPEKVKKLTFDFDLMVNDYLGALEKIDDIAGTISVDAIFPHVSVIQDYKNITKLYPEFSVGFALDPGDNAETIAQNFDLQSVPVIQIMSVIPGYQGSPFIEDSLNKIDLLRMNDYRNKIYIDGGINETSLKTILDRELKPDVLCIGSYLSKAKNLEAHVKKLQKIAV